MTGRRINGTVPSIQYCQDERCSQNINYLNIPFDQFDMPIGKIGIFLIHQEQLLRVDLRADSIHLRLVLRSDLNLEGGFKEQ